MGEEGQLKGRGRAERKGRSQERGGEEKGGRKREKEEEGGGRGREGEEGRIWGQLVNSFKPQRVLWISLQT